MLLDLSKPFDQIKFKQYCNKLYSDKSKVELKKFQESDRSKDQNSYYHVVLGYLAIEIGCTLQEVKTITKMRFGKFMMKWVDGEYIPASSADCSKEQMTEFIEWLRIDLGNNTLGIYIPTPEEYRDNKFEVEKDLQSVL